MSGKWKIGITILVVMILGIVGISAAAQNDAASEPLKYYFYGNPGESEAETAAAIAFTDANPEISVEAIHVPTAYEDKIRILVAGGTPPDAAVWNPEHIAKLYKSMLPLQDLVSRDIDTDVYLYPEDFFAAGSYEGSLYILPKRYDGIGVMVYNKSLLESKGLALPDSPYPKKLTVEEFAELADQISEDTNGDGVNDIFGCDPMFYGITYSWFGIQNDGMGNDYKSPAWTSPEMLDMLRYIYRGQVEEGWALPWGENRLEWFKSGKLGMMTDFGLYLLPELKTITDFEWGVAARPGLEAPINRPGGIAVFKDSKNTEGAWEFAKFLSTDIRAQTALSSAFGMGVTKASAEKFLSTFDRDLSYMATAVLPAPERVVASPTARFGDMMGMLWQEKDAFYAGEVGPEKFASTVQSLFEQVIKEELEAAE
jgi:ABC-type glycerol-3-phosphate transport system substrate-binding protein